MLSFSLLQLSGIFGPGGGSDSGTNPLTYVLWFAPIFLLMVYGQKFQSWMILSDVSKSLTKLKTMKETARNEAIDYVKLTGPNYTYKVVHLHSVASLMNKT